MTARTSLAARITAVFAAGLLAFSGASAFAAPTDTGAETQASSKENQRCKKNQEKKHKCKKPQKQGKPELKPKPEPKGFVPGRVVELTYMGPAIGGVDTPAVNPFGLIAPVNFIPGLGESMATIEIIDDNSPKASAGFSWDSDGDGINDKGIDVCGSTPKPVEVQPGTQYNVFPYLLPGTSCTDGVATSGTIIVTFNKV